MKKNKKGQTSTEFLVLLGIALFVLLVMVFISNAQLGDISTLKEQNDAKNAVRDLSSAAKDVYAQGEGAKKKVYIVLPSSYDPDASMIQNHSILLNARETDYIAIKGFEVHGNFPGTSGAHWVWVISEGNRVRIGSAMITTSKNSIYILVDRNESSMTSFSIGSIWPSEITVTPATTWTPADVTASMDPSVSFNLNGGEDQTIELTFTANENAVGYYNGEISFAADDGFGNDETITIPITVEVVRYETTVADAPLTVIPDFWAENMEAGDSAEKTFSICTNSDTSVTGVIFSMVGGSPGDWIGNTTALGAIGVDSCEQKIFTLNVPNDTSAGTYEGTITVTGTGVAGAEDTITLYIAIQETETGSCELGVGGNLTCNCPVGMNYLDTPSCNCQAATIYVSGGVIVGGPDDGNPFVGTLRGSSGEDIIAGTNESDIIYGGTGNDRICGLGGDDVIYGENGNDILDSGEGSDTIDGGGAGDQIYGKGGDDILLGDQGNDAIDGGDGADTITGGTGNDEIYGGSGNDIIDGSDGTDIICGNSGNDTMLGDDDNDILDGGGDTDTINGGDDSDICYRGETMTSCETQHSGDYPNCGST